ncbi:MAG TPA: hypothetical protein VF790_06640 [Dissulfurispiraceae bacterium]
MKIECYLSVGCSSEEALRGNIRAALSLEGIDAEVTFSRIKEEEASVRGLKGSPSVLVDGRDIDPQGMSGFS